MCRVWFGLLVLSALPAFAPAPFPRPSRSSRDGDRIDAAAFQGTWRVVGMVRYDANGTGTPHGWSVTHVRIAGDHWGFATGPNAGGGTHHFRIDGDRRPARLDFYSDAKREGPPSGMGIIRRRGDEVEIVYVFGTTTRAEDFARPPSGQYRLTLRRER